MWGKPEKEWVGRKIPGRGKKDLSALVFAPFFSLQQSHDLEKKNLRKIRTPASRKIKFVQKWQKAERIGKVYQGCLFSSVFLDSFRDSQSPRNNCGIIMSSSNLKRWWYNYVMRKSCILFVLERNESRKCLCKLVVKAAKLWEELFCQEIFSKKINCCKNRNFYT